MYSNGKVEKMRGQEKDEYRRQDGKRTKVKKPRRDKRNENYDGNSEKVWFLESNTI